MNKTFALIIGTLLLLVALLSGVLYLKLHTKPVEQVVPTDFAYSTDALDVSIKYPVIPGATEEAKQADAIIRSDIQAKIVRFESDARDSAALGIDLPKSVKSTVTGGPSIEEQNERYAAIYLGMEWYLRGAAHPSHTIDTYVYDYQNAKLVSPDEFFLANSDYLTLLSTIAKDDLINQSKTGDLGYVVDEAMLNEGITPTKDHFKHMLPLRDGLAIYFDEYQVAPYAAGPQQVVIPYAKLQEVIDPNGVLGMYVKK